MTHSIRLYRDTAGEYRWTRRATNGEPITNSREGYKRREDAMWGFRLANPDWWRCALIDDTKTVGETVMSERIDFIERPRRVKGSGDHNWADWSDTQLGRGRTCKDCGCEDDGYVQPCIGGTA